MSPEKFINGRDKKLDRLKNYIFAVNNVMLLVMGGYKVYEQAESSLLRLLKENHYTESVSIELVAVWDNEEASICYWLKNK